VHGYPCAVWVEILNCDYRRPVVCIASKNKSSIQFLTRLIMIPVIEIQCVVHYCR
jgi:hypothetical protein